LMNFSSSMRRSTRSRLRSTWSGVR